VTKKRRDKTGGHIAPRGNGYGKKSEKGYRPIKGNGKLDTSNPPRDGSGVPSKSSGHIKKNRGD